MTDREMVMHLCERLGLVETSFNLIGCHSNGYCMDDLGYLYRRIIKKNPIDTKNCEKCVAIIYLEIYFGL